MQITPEIVNALKHLRKTYLYPETQAAFDTLDNAGIFAAIDEATGYDVNPEQRVSKCNCSENVSFEGHLTGCPGDPAEWGDLAFDVIGEDDMRTVAARIRNNR